MRAFLLAATLGVTLSAAIIAQRGALQFPDAVKADPAHYKVEAENDLVRVVRVKYGPGEKSVMHTHPASCGTFLNDQTFRFTMPDGKTQESPVHAGQVQCGDAEIHLPQNTKRTPAELVLVEFKNRQTFNK